MSEWISIIGGLVALTIGAELLIRGSTALARRMGVSELLIGLTLVGFGTSTPELVSSVQAALVGSPGVAVGNVVGSNIANILLILGLSALIAPIAVERKSFNRDAAALSVATVVVLAVAYTGGYERLAGAGFLIALAVYIIVAFASERAKPSAPETRRHEEEAAALPAGPDSTFVNVALVIAGLGLLMVGARFLVSGAIEIASTLGVSETVIGLTVVALGTSLPELFTSAMAAFRGRSALALGNVIGSNIYNLLGILGATALIQPIAVPQQILAVDNWVLFGATGVMIFFALSRNRVERLEGAALLLGYFVYIAWLVIAAPK